MIRTPIEFNSVSEPFAYALESDNYGLSITPLEQSLYIHTLIFTWIFLYGLTHLIQVGFSFTVGTVNQLHRFNTLLNWLLMLNTQNSNL